MGVDRAVHAWSEGDRTTADDRAAGSRGRAPLYRLDGLPVAGIAGPLPAGFDGSTLFRCLRHGLWRTINFHVVAAARLALGREASPRQR